MGFFNNIFKKKDPLDDIGGLPGSNQGMGFTPGADPMAGLNTGLDFEQDNQNQFDSFGNNRPRQRENTYEPKSNFGPQLQDNSKDLQILIAKIDALRAEVANLSHKIEDLERKQDQRKYPWQQ